MKKILLTTALVLSVMATLMAQTDSTSYVEEEKKGFDKSRLFRGR
jgi:hypothetical protein